ncbi:MAG TPA: SPOCS domain-containing protein [Bacillota bacterium]|nr:SPOCS domain-containing protein [Bacillota bacterium]
MSCCCQTVVTPKQQVQTQTERIKVLKVIGEAIAQVVVEGSIRINAIKIDRINAELRNVVDHVFHNKVVKQGVIHKQIFFVDPEGIVRHTTEEIPFMVAVDIPGVEPNNSFLEIQNHLLDIATDFILTPAVGTTLGTLQQKVVAHILIKASEWTQLDVVTKVDVFPKVNSSQQFVCRSC